MMLKYSKISHFTQHHNLLQNYLHNSEKKDSFPIDASTLPGDRRVLNSIFVPHAKKAFQCCSVLTGRKRRGLLRSPLSMCA